MRKILLSLCMAAYAVGAWALDGNYLRLDMSAARATQSYEGNKKAVNAIDGATTGLHGGWDNNELKTLSGEFTSQNPLEKDANWWAVDLGRDGVLDALKIYFEGAYATEFLVEASDDGASWTEIAHIEGNTETNFEYVFPESHSAKMFRLNFLNATNAAWGIKFYEVELYRDTERIEDISFKLASEQAGLSLLVRGESNRTFAYAFDKDDNQIGLIEDFTLTSTTEGVQIDGTSVTPSNLGEADFTITYFGKAYPATATVLDCLVYADGPWKAEITSISPEDVTHPEYMIDLDDSNNGGWGDGKLGSEKIIPYGQAWFTIDLKRECNISAIRALNSGAWINAYTIEFFDENPDAGTAVAPKYSYEYKAVAGAGKTEYIHLPALVRARYIKFNVTEIAVPIWGGRFSEICFYGPDNAKLQVDRIVLSDNKGVVGRDTYVKVQAVAEDGNLLYDNLDAQFGFGDKADAIQIGEKTADGYRFTGISEAVVPLTFTAQPPASDAMYGTANFIVASPLDQHVCLVNHITNKLSVAHQYNPQGDYNADNAINGVHDNDYFLSGWDADALAMDGDALDQHANWWTVNLGRDANVEAVRILWTDNYARRYKIQLFGNDVNLWEEYRTNPAAADEKAIYTQIVEYTGATDLVRFDDVISGVRSFRITMLEAAGDAGIQMHEVCLLGRENPDFTINSLALVRKDVNVGETRSYSIYGLTNSGYTLGGLDGAKLSIAENAADFKGEIRIEPDGRITGVRKGITPIVLSWGGITVNTFMEVTTSDWSNTVNIARKYRTSKPSTTSKNGFTLGNPMASATSFGIAGAENESVRGLIDGDWMSWTITAEETRAEVKPYVTIDLGSAFPINEFNIHWNADGDGEGNGSYIMLSGNYRVYGSTDNSNWTELYTVANRPAATYDIDRHAFATGTYRYVKFEFTSPKTYGQSIAINEITIGGPEFYNADADTYTDYPGSYVLNVATPSFDRSNALDHEIDNDWIVTSTSVNAKNQLMISYMAVDCYGRSYLPENAEVKLYRVNDDNTLGDELEPILENDGTQKLHHYRNIHWPVFYYTASKIGQEKVRAVITGADFTPVTTDLTVYTISERGNVNRYAYAYDNAVNTSADWESGDRTGDRDLTYLGTAPQNAADGSYGSWYVIGYYGDGDHMGQTYKYPANTTLERPYELIMDYRGMNHDEVNVADRFVKELDMIGIQYEGAFARDYNVYLLHCDDNGVVADENAWEKVATFVNMPNMGIGQVDTHRIYPATADGMPDIDAEGRIKPWTNVAAVKIELITTGTQWGIKMMESAIYGMLNKTVLPLDMAQSVYADKEATAPAQGNNKYYSFDLEVTTPFNDADYVLSELQALENELPAVKSYRLSLHMLELDGNDYRELAFTEALAPSAVIVDGIEHEGSVADGIYTVVVPADESNMINGVIFKNLDPSKYYRLSAMPLTADGQEINSVDINDTQLEDLFIPTAPFAANSLGIEAIEDEITNIDNLMTENGAPASLGAAYDSRKTVFHRLNKAYVNGRFDALPITNEVASNWQVTYTTDITLNEADAYSFQTQLAEANSALSARIEYLPLNTVLRKSAEVTDGLDGAPEDIRSIDLNVLDPEAKMSVEAVNAVTYINGEKQATRFSTESSAELSQDVIAATFAAPAVTGTNKKVVYVSVEAARWDALLLHSFELTSSLNNYAGFYSTNELHSASEAEGTDGAFIKGGKAMAETDDVFPGFNIPGFGIPGFGDDNTNFGHLAAFNNTLGFQLHNVVNGQPEEIDAVAPVYSLITGEYPLALAPVVDGNISDVAGPVLRVEDVVAANLASIYREGAANMQLISAPSAVKTEIDIEHDLTTGIGNVSADAAADLSVYPNPADDIISVTSAAELGSVEIYTLAGAAMMNVPAEGTSATVNVSDLDSGIYILRAAGTTTRLIKR